MSQVDSLSGFTLTTNGTLTLPSGLHGEGITGWSSSNYLSLSDIDFDFNGASFSVGVWAKVQTALTSSDRVLIGVYDSDDDSVCWELKISNSSGNSSFFLDNGTTTAEVSVTGLPAIGWHLFVATFNNDSGEIGLKIDDGTQVLTSISGGPKSPTTLSMQVGKKITGDPLDSDIILDDLFFYDRVLFPFEIDEIWDNGNGLEFGDLAFPITPNLEDINAELNTLGYLDLSSAISELENLGYTIISTPWTGELSEDLSGTSGTLTRGEFSIPAFQSSSTLEVTKSYDTTDLNGYPYIGFVAFEGSNYLGSGILIYRDYDNTASLKDLWFPNQYRNLFVYILNEDGSVVESVDTSTRTIYSSNQSPGTDGYYLTSSFSDDDGIWGVRIGSDLDGNGGPYMNADSANSYGVENRDFTDGSIFCDAHWASTLGSNHQFIYFVKQV
jgi:hypothetical protein